MDVLTRNNVHESGRGRRAMVFAHGFGCDQNMWRFVAPEFESDFKVILFDHVGAGGSDLSAYDKTKYSTLDGYADDVVEIGSRAGAERRRLRRSFGQRDDRDPGLVEGSGIVRPPGIGRPVRQIHRRWRLRRRIQRKADRGAARVSGGQPHGLVGRDGPFHHGQPGPPGTGRRTDQQLLPDRSRNRQGIRARHLHVRQQGGPLQGHDSDPDPSMQRGHHRLRRGRQVRA